MSVDRVVPLTPALWPKLEALFGKQGACMGCWCMYWRMPRAAWNAALGAKAKRLFKQRVAGGPPPGMLALAGGEAVGWLQIGPRTDTPQWSTPRRVSAPLDPEDADNGATWVATCFYVRSSARGQGVTSALLDAGIAYAKKRGAKAIEACPIDAEKSTSGAMYVGHVGAFRRAGFREIARRKPNRPLMRLSLAKSARR